MDVFCDTIKLALSFLTNGSAAPMGVTTTLGTPLKKYRSLPLQKLFRHIIPKRQK